MGNKERNLVQAPVVAIRPVSRFDQQVVLALVLRVRQEFTMPTRLETVDADLNDVLHAYPTRFVLVLPKRAAAISRSR